MKYWRTK